MNDRLRQDPRTAWAAHVYTRSGTFQPISEWEAEEVLEKLGSHEHVEVFARGRLLRGGDPGWESERSHKRLAFRTLTRGVLLPLTDDTDAPWSSRSASWAECRSLRAAPDTLLFDGGVEIHAPMITAEGLPDDALRSLLETGAGWWILKLPEVPGVLPLPPSLDVRQCGDRGRATVGSGVNIPTGWASLEELAATHLRSLGFPEARQTAPGRDGGLDVVAENLAAQVKMLALPVSRPVLQQLMGAAIGIEHVACFSSSGFTADGTSYAEAHGICLFTVAADGSISPLNEAATQLGTYPVDAAWQATTAYMNVVEERAVPFMDWADEWRPAFEWDHETCLSLRIDDYMERARALLMDPEDPGLKIVEPKRVFATPKEAAVNHHHAELLLATWATHAGVPYPPTGGPTRGRPDEDQKPSPPPSPTNLADFY